MTHHRSTRNSPSSATIATVDDEDKLIAVALHIVETMGSTDEAMKHDMVHMLASYNPRFSPDRLAPPADDCRRRMASLDRTISCYVLSTESVWPDSGSPESFLNAIDELIATRRELYDSGGGSQRQWLVDKADGLIRSSMLRLEEEFTSLIQREASAGSSEAMSEEEEEEEAIPISSPVSDEDQIPVASPAVETEPLSPGIVADLCQIAKRMKAGGYGKICALAYGRARAESLQRSLARVGAREWPTEKLQMSSWPKVHKEINRWISAARVAFRVVFPSERRLCSRVFTDLAPVADLSFSELCCEPALQLLAFPRSVARGSGAPECLFDVMDVYEALQDLAKDFQALFPDLLCSSVRSESSTVRAELRAAIRCILAQLEELIGCDPATGQCPRGDVHRVTRYVTNYLQAALKSSQKTLEEALEYPRKREAAADPDCPSPLEARIRRIMEILLGNLEEKSKAYRDPSLGHVFLVNNGQYVIRKVRGNKLEEMMGEEWIRRQMTKVRYLHMEYQRNTWGRLIGLLKHGGGGRNSGESARALREKLRRFSVGFEVVWRAQKEWTVVDGQTREEMRVAAMTCVIPAYRAFLGRLSAAVGGREAERSAKFTLEDVEVRITGIFQG